MRSDRVTHWLRLVGCRRRPHAPTLCRQLAEADNIGRRTELTQQKYKIYETKVLENMHELAAENYNEILKAEVVVVATLYNA